MDPVTNSIAALGSLALLLQPPAVPKAEDVVTNAPAVEAAEVLFPDWVGLRPKLAAHGIEFTAQYFAEVMGNVTGGTKREAVYGGLVNLAADIDLASAIGWSGAQLHGAFLYPHGRSLTERQINDLFVLSNLDASDDAHLFELWLEQHLFAEQLSVRAGQLAIDQEFAFTEQGALFNNAAFGWFPIAGNNVTAPVYPQGAPGVRIKWNAHANWFAQVAVTDGDVNPVDAAGNETNPHGVEFRFDEGAFLIGELGTSWDWDGHAGSVKWGGWYHTAATADIRFDDTGLSLANPLSSGNPAPRGANWGFYAGAEQVLWREHPAEPESMEALGVFARAGYVPSDRNLISWYAEGGVTRTGLLPGRDNDVCGLAFALGRLSSAQRELGRDANFFNATATPLPDFELVFEAEYQVHLCPGFVAQPGLQYVIHPGGSRASNDALILSFRTILEF